ncbi:MAG TPA: hypothetical protein VGX03_08400 [Candidatus Binatia bacterium]|jgi:hypothetical protein|nr:hypothetical protein [Candidatus Binatia bacterium]
MRLWKSVVTVGLGVVLLAGSAQAAYDDYNDYTDSHPLRLIAYILHPIGYTAEWLALRPLHALVTQPELQPVFGTDAYGPGFQEYGINTIARPPAPAAVAPPAVSSAELDALRRAAEAAQIAADEAKRAADEARRAADEAALSASKSGRAFEKSLQK